jgi:hypothetical protein
VSRREQLDEARPTRRSHERLDPSARLFGSVALVHGRTGTRLVVVVATAERERDGDHDDRCELPGRAHVRSRISAREFAASVTPTAVRPYSDFVLRAGRPSAAAMGC